MFCSKEKSISVYCSNAQVVCLVPMPRFAGVNSDKAGKPVTLRYITNVHPEFGTRWRLYKDLRGLNKEDFSAWKVDLVIYVLADGTLLAADKATCQKATEAVNSASSTGAKCLEHLVVDLVLLDSLPTKTSDAVIYPDLPAFQF